MLRKKLNNIISKWKGHPYTIDEQIPVSRLFIIALSRALMLLKGKLSFIKNGGRLFFSWKASVRSRSKLKLGHSVTIGSGAFIDALSREGIILGNNVSVGRYTRIEATGNLQYIGKGMKVGNNVGLGIHSFYGCAGGITIGDDTIFGDFVSLHAENHVMSDLQIPVRLQGTTHTGILIGNNCWIGAKATILDGAVLQDGCVIAAGAVVTEGVYERNGLYGGVPAKFIKYRNT
jgi:acetyltransferase-like isoleucine patch superfamily enzyme